MPITGDATVITIRALSITDPVYQISGYIFDEATDPLAGTLVTLSGDASDSTTTFGDLGYSFAGLSNGDYTVTATKYGYVFVNDHEDVTIAYDNVIVDPMVAIDFLTLPYDYSISDVTGSSGLISEESDWDVWDFQPNSGDIISAVNDSSDWKPAWATKALQMTFAGAARESNLQILPGPIDPSLTSLRISWICRDSGRADRCSATAGVYDAGIFTGATFLSSHNCGHYGNYNPDKLYATSRYEEATVRDEINYVDQGVNIDGQRYHWFRIEWNFTTGVITYSCIRAQDSAVQYSNTGSVDAAGTTLGHVASNLIYFGVLPTEDPSNLQFLRFWIGTASDAWPT